MANMKGKSAELVNIEDSGIRLSVHQKSKIDFIKESVPKPQGYLPPKSVPTWEIIPIEQKLPLLPAPPGALYFTRGPLGKSLLRKPLDFSVSDPLNKERIPSDKYELLHDPTTRINFNPHAREALIKRGAVNENGEVICTLKEFNRYRKYLATLYNDRVREKIAELDDLKNFERESARAFIRQELMKRGEGAQALRNERVEKAKKFLREKEEAKREELDMKMKLENMRKLELEEKRKREQAEKIKSLEIKKAMQKKRLLNRYSNELEWRKTNLHYVALKEMKSAAIREHLKNQKKIKLENKQTDWFENKIVSASERLQREKEVQSNYIYEMKRRAIKRQKNIERFRAELPKRIAQRLAKQRKLDETVRKYAMRWLNRVRERLRKPNDEQHESLWFSQNKNCLADVVKYLYEQSGHEKLDDVVMNILKFKEALKQQLYLDEEEEYDEDEDDYFDE